MKSISFDNPYLLLLIIPLIAATVVPYILAFKNGKKSKGVVASFVLHIVISSLITLALAGMTLTTVMTETQVYIVADVSYSSNANLDKIDSYIDKLQGNLPRNSSVGVVCFGKDYELLTPPGAAISSVKNAAVDNSATDISQALNYTATLFEEGTVKRIVLITDGKETDSNSTSKLMSSIENLHTNDIHLDVIYVDNNLAEDATEIQISGVDYTQSVYLNHESVAGILVNSSYDTQALLTVEKNGESYINKAITLTKGYNIVNIDLETNVSGEFDYKLNVSSEDDTSKYNNDYIFTQTVNEGLKVLLVTSSKADEARAKELYGEHAEIDVYLNNKNVPTSVEELCKYDEIIISGVDVRELNNVTAFIESVETVVSVFGKSLVTFGDLQIQNKTDECLEMLSDILPVKFGNNSGAPKLYTIVLDTSRSMFQVSRFAVMKNSAMSLLDLLDEDDYVALVSFAGTITLTQPTRASEANVLELKDYISNLQPTQGTFLGAAMQEAYDMISGLSYSEKQVMLISDGMSYSLEEVDAVAVSEEMHKSGMVVSVINPYVKVDEGVRTLKNIAEAGGGEYYYLENEESSSLQELIFADIANDLTETVIEEQSPVYINIDADAATEGVFSLPDVGGYVNSRPKSSATTVLSVDYHKNETTTLKVPLYAYWTYGSGRAASFTSSFTGSWASLWNDSDSSAIFHENVLISNTPQQRVDYPYSLNVESDGVSASVELIAVNLNPYATADIVITMPDGSVIEDSMAFDSKSYYYEFPTANIGKYSVKVSYTANKITYDADAVFSLSYAAEYDAFTVFNSAALYTAVRDRGTVSEDTVPRIKNDDGEVATYNLSLAMPFMVAAIVLYVADIIVRKLKINDIKSFFKRKSKKGAAK